MQANFSLIKHFEPDHFAMPLGISAVALMWRANNLGAADGVDNHLGAPQALWHTIGYIAVVTLGIQLILLVCSRGRGNGDASFSSWNRDNRRGAHILSSACVSYWACWHVCTAWP